MTVLSAQTIRRLKILTPTLEAYKGIDGYSGGLSACSYDLAIAETHILLPGEFRLASAAEHFNIPNNIVAIVHDKSSWARRGLTVQNTTAEPGWRGYLTLELTNHSDQSIRIEANTPICQVLFHRLDEPTELPYQGKYQDQEAGPQPWRKV